MILMLTVNTETTLNVVRLSFSDHTNHIACYQADADGNFILFSPAWQDTELNGSRAQPLSLSTVYMCGICSNFFFSFSLAGQQERAKALQDLFCTFTPQFHMEKRLCLNFLYYKRRTGIVRCIRVKVCGTLWMEAALGSMHTCDSEQKTQALRGILSIPALSC